MTAAVALVGDERLSVDPEAYPTASFEATFRCASGDPIPGEWTGVPIAALLDEPVVPDDATHLRVRGADGFAVCLRLGDVLDGLVAFERRPIGDDGGDSAVDASGLPRFVAPSVSGTRTVKDVTTIEPVALAPDEDPESYEEVLLEA